MFFVYKVGEHKIWVRSEDWLWKKLDKSSFKPGKTDSNATKSKWLVWPFWSAFSLCLKTSPPASLDKFAWAKSKIWMLTYARNGCSSLKCRSSCSRLIRTDGQKNRIKTQLGWVFTWIINYSLRQPHYEPKTLYDSQLCQFPWTGIRLAATAVNASL